MLNLGITMDKRQLFAICTCLALMSFCATITIGLEPVYAVQLGADSASTGLFVALAFLTVTLGNITGGWLSDRIGKRKLMLYISCVVWILTALSMTQATEIVGLTVTTALFWFPGGIVIAVLNIIAALSTVEGERGKVFGWTALASGVGTLLAGVIAGPIADRWGFPVVFMVMAGTIALIFAIAIFIQDKPSPREAIPSQTKGGARAPKQTGIGYLAILVLVAHLLARLGQFIGGLARPLAMTHLGFDAAAVSSTLAVSAAVTLPLPLILGWLSDKAGRKVFLITCYALGVLGLVVLLPAYLLWQFWLSATLIAISNSANGVAQAFVADLVPRAAMGRGMSLFNTTALVAGIIGLSIGGYMMQTLGINPALVIGGVLQMIAISLVLRVRKATPIPEAIPNIAEP